MNTTILGVLLQAAVFLLNISTHQNLSADQRTQALNIAQSLVSSVVQGMENPAAQSTIGVTTPSPYANGVAVPTSGQSTVTPGVPTPLPQNTGYNSQQGVATPTLPVFSNSPLSVSALMSGSSFPHAKSQTDNLGTIVFKANNAGNISLNSVKLTFQGDALTTTNFLNGVVLLDANGNDVVSSMKATVSVSSPCIGTNSCTKTWVFGSGQSGLLITSGGSYTFKLIANSLNTTLTTSGVNSHLNVYIPLNDGDVVYTTGDGVTRNYQTEGTISSLGYIL